MGLQLVHRAPKRVHGNRALRCRLRLDMAFCAWMRECQFDGAGGESVNLLTSPSFLPSPRDFA